MGDLVRIGLERMGAVPLPYGPVYDPADAVARALQDRASAAVGIPTQLLAMARQRSGARLKGKIKNVLLSTDYVPEAIGRVLEERWGCRVYNHYGTTEMGLGGGVQCSARRGYHFREADLLWRSLSRAQGAGSGRRDRRNCLYHAHPNRHAADPLPHRDCRFFPALRAGQCCKVWSRLSIVSLS